MKHWYCDGNPIWRLIFQFSIGFCSIILFTNCVKQDNIPCHKSQDIFVIRDSSDLAYAENLFFSCDSTSAASETAGLCRNIGRYYETSLYNNKEALKWYGRAQWIYGRHKMTDSTAMMDYRMAVLYYRENLFHYSLEYGYNALNNFTRLKDTLNMVKSYNMIGGIYRICDDTVSAKKFFQLSLDYAKTIKDTGTAVTALNNLIVSTSSKDSASIRTILAEASKYSRAAKDTAKLFWIYTNTATTYINCKMYREANRCLDTAYLYAEAVENHGEYHLNRAITYLHSGNTETARSEIELATFFFHRYNMASMLPYCNEVKQGILAAEGDYKTAYELISDDTSNRADGINTIDKAVFIRIFDTMADIRIKQQMDNIKERQMKFVFLSALGFLLSLNILLLIALRNRKQKAAILLKEQEVKSGNQNLKLKIMQQFAMSKMLDNIISKIRSVGKDNPAEKEIEAICMEIDGIKHNTIWKELDKYALDIDKLANTTLFDEYPNLTANERRLCTLLNMNLSTKEISLITRQNPDTVKMARYRLRAKFNLTNSDITLQEFLQKYNNA